MTLLVFLAGALTGAIATAFLFTLSERPAELFGAVAGTLLRPVMPFWVWANVTYRISSYPACTPTGEPVKIVTDGRDWVGVLYANRLGFSPLLLLPAGLVRLAVRTFGREVKVALSADELDQGYIFRGLRITRALTFAVRRPEDLAHLGEHSRYPTVDITA